MREAIQLREISMAKMRVMRAKSDDFGIEEELLRYYDYIHHYREARNKFIKLPLIKQEQDLHKRLTKLTRKSQPMNRYAAGLLMEDVPDNAIKRATAERQKVLLVLKELIEQ